MVGPDKRDRRRRNVRKRDHVENQETEDTDGRQTSSIKETGFEGEISFHLKNSVF
jgi:hypothetical protein